MLNKYRSLSKDNTSVTFFPTGMIRVNYCITVPPISVCDFELFNDDKLECHAYTHTRRASCARDKLVVWYIDSERPSEWVGEYEQLVVVVVCWWSNERIDWSFSSMVDEWIIQQDDGVCVCTDFSCLTGTRSREEIQWHRWLSIDLRSFGDQFSLTHLFLNGKRDARLCSSWHLAISFFRTSGDSTSFSKLVFSPLCCCWSLLALRSHGLIITLVPPPLAQAFFVLWHRW